MAETSEVPRTTTELKINLDKLKSRVREYIDKVRLIRENESTVIALFVTFRNTSLSHESPIALISPSVYV